MRTIIRGLLPGLLVLSAMVAVPTARAGPIRYRPVVAIIDTGLDPYHEDFSDPTARRHPSTFLPGYPRGAPALNLHLDTTDYEAARNLDDGPVWSKVRPNTLYWIPGTNVVGAVFVPKTTVQDELNGQSVTVDSSGRPQYPIVSGSDHGTKVGSVLAGRRHGSCRDCLIVVVAAASNEAGLRWAASQPWIDIVSNSYGAPAGLPTGGTVAGTPTTGRIDQASRAAAASGKPVFFSSGNGLTQAGPVVHATPDRGVTWTSAYSGPPWVVAVGAASPANGQPTSWHNVPVDVVSYGKDWPAAAPRSLNGESTFFGTSCATPIAAGVAAEALRLARAGMGDTGVGSRGGSLVRAARGARLPRSGPLADGRLTRSELVDSLLRTARWVPATASSLAADPFVTPGTDHSYVYQGFGLVDPKTVRPLADVLLGRAAAPARDEMSGWYEDQRAVRTALWGPSPA